MKTGRRGFLGAVAAVFAGRKLPAAPVLKKGDVLKVNLKTGYPVAVTLVERMACMQCSDHYVPTDSPSLMCHVEYPKYDPNDIGLGLGGGIRTSLVRTADLANDGKRFVEMDRKLYRIPIDLSPMFPAVQIGVEP